MSCLRTISQHGKHNITVNVIQMCYMFRNNDFVQKCTTPLALLRKSEKPGINTHLV